MEKVSVQCIIGNLNHQVGKYSNGVKKKEINYKINNDILTFEKLTLKPNIEKSKRSKL